MYLKELHIRNFKSIRKADILFPSMALVVGANAVGKSNLISVFRFLSDVLTQGLETAISLQGGIGWMANVNLSKGTPIEIGFILDLTGEKWSRFIRTLDKESDLKFELNFRTIESSFIIRPYVRGNGYRIEKDILKLRLIMTRKDDSSGNKEDDVIPDGDKVCVVYERQRRANGQYIFTFGTSRDEEVSDSSCADNACEILREDSTFQFFGGFTEENHSELLFSSASFLLHPDFTAENFIRIFDFDAKEIKKPCPIASVPYLKDDGSNISAIMKGILNDRRRGRQLRDYVSDYLPFVAGIDVDSSVDKSLRYRIRECYSETRFQQNLLSDGTVSVLAILIALYFQEQYILILEEPERNLHPRLLAKLLDSSEDVSTEKQVILTTHNPEFLKHANIEHVLLVSRDSDGFTTFSFPKDSETVQAFLKNDLGLDDLFLQDMLGA